MNNYVGSIRNMKQEHFLTLTFQRKMPKKGAINVTLENILKELEQNHNFISDHNYLEYKNKLEQI